MRTFFKRKPIQPHDGKVFGKIPRPSQDVLRWSDNPEVNRGGDSENGLIIPNRNAPDHRSPRMQPVTSEFSGSTSVASMATHAAQVDGCIFETCQDRGPRSVRPRPFNNPHHKRDCRPAPTRYLLSTVGKLLRAQPQCNLTQAKAPDVPPSDRDEKAAILDCSR